MKPLIEFFQNLQGDHLLKTTEIDGQALCVKGGLLAEGIDCCDVSDTCCDSYD